MEPENQSPTNDVPPGVALQPAVPAAEKPSENEFRRAQEAAALDRIKARALEQRIQDMQHANAVLNAARQENAVEQIEALRQELVAERHKNQQQQQLMEDLSAFANQKTSLLRRLELMEAELQQKSKQLQETNARHLAELGRQRAVLELRHKEELNDAFRKGREEAEQNIVIDAKLLKEQNVELQRSLNVIKREVQAPKEAEVGQLVDVDLQKELERRLGAQAKEITQLRIKLKQSGQETTQKTAQAQEFLQNALKKSEEQNKQLQRELQAMEKLLYVKCQELYKVRTLAAAILQKRTNLEWVLNKCIQETFDVEQAELQEFKGSMNEMLAQQAQGLQIKNEIKAEEVRTKVIQWMETIDGQRKE